MVRGRLIIAGADPVVLPSRHEAFGVAIREAWAVRAWQQPSPLLNNRLYA